MNRIMRPPDSLPEIYLYRDPIDFRKSYRGIGAIIELELGHNPFSGSLYIFVNRARNKVKCLFWETNGFVLYYKSLSEEKFKWPKDDTELMTLTGQEINFLLDGYDLSAMKPHKKLHYQSLF
ncbi:MAG: IS66 family insertion sequence element accessory protein TnpB [Pseudomonadales bacterium]|nr:IS66 family insertion sequence element accessory protein TnpB [Pseudomonadales bacterium]